MSNKITTNLSDQAIAVLMVTLQKCILEQADITKILKDFEFKRVRDRERKLDSLMILNPPGQLSVGPPISEIEEV